MHLMRLMHSIRPICTILAPPLAFPRPRPKSAPTTRRRRSGGPTGLAPTVIALATLCATPPAPANETGEAPRWSGSIGLGVAHFPLYPGSRERQTRGGPLIELRHGRWFLGPVPEGQSPYALGVDLLAGRQGRVGLAVSTDAAKIRDKDDAARIRGLGDIDGTQRAHLYGLWLTPRHVVGVNLAADIGGQDLGTTLSASWQLAFRPTPAWRLTIGPGFIWGNARHQRTVFGVDAGQATHSGFPVYRPDAAVTSVRLLASAHYQIDRRWSTGLRFAYDRLRDDAARSPIVERRHQGSMVAYGLYHF